MAAYLLAEAAVTDPVAYESYKQLAQSAIAQYGGRYLVRGGSSQILEGDWKAPPRLVIVEFPSLDQAQKFYDSPEYRAARAARQGAADMNMLVVQGI